MTCASRACGCEGSCDCTACGVPRYFSDWVSAHEIFAEAQGHCVSGGIPWWSAATKAHTLAEGLQGLQATEWIAALQLLSQLEGSHG